MPRITEAPTSSSHILNVISRDLKFPGDSNTTNRQMTSFYVLAVMTTPLDAEDLQRHSPQERAAQEARRRISAMLSVSAIWVMIFQLQENHLPRLCYSTFFLPERKGTTDRAWGPVGYYRAMENLIF